MLLRADRLGINLVSGHCPECGNTLCICDMIDVGDRIRAKLREIDRLADLIKAERDSYSMLQHAHDLRRASRTLIALCEQARRERKEKLAADKRMAAVATMPAWPGPTC